MAQTDARIQSEAESFGESHQPESGQERQARREHEFDERLAEINREMAAGADERGAASDH